VQHFYAFATALYSLLVYKTNNKRKKLTYIGPRFESHLWQNVISALFCVVLSCVGTGLVVGRSPIQGVPTKCLNEFIVSEVNPESEGQWA